MTLVCYKFIGLALRGFFKGDFMEILGIAVHIIIFIIAFHISS